MFLPWRLRVDQCGPSTSSPLKQDPSRCQEPVANKLCSERADTPIELVGAVRKDALHAALSGARAMHTTRAAMPEIRLLEKIRKHNWPAEPRTVVVPRFTF